MKRLKRVGLATARSYTARGAASLSLNDGELGETGALVRFASYVRRRKVNAEGFIFTRYMVEVVLHGGLTYAAVLEAQRAAVEVV